MNNLYLGMTREERGKYKLGCGRRHNAEWDGLAIRATREIWMGKEVLLDYRPKERTLATKRLLAQRVKKKNAKSKKTQRSVA